MATAPAPIYNIGPYSNANYNNDAVLNYAAQYGVDPSQIVYTPGQGYSVGGPGGNAPSQFTPQYIGGQTATGGGVAPSPLNPINYATNQTAQQVAGLTGGQVVPDTAMGTGAGASIGIPTPNGIQLPSGQVVDAGVIANVLSRYPDPQSAAQQLAIQSGGAIQVTPQQIAQFQGTATPTPGSTAGAGAGSQTTLGTAAGGGGGAPAPVAPNPILSSPSGLATGGAPASASASAAAPAPAPVQTSNLVQGGTSGGLAPRSVTGTGTGTGTGTSVNVGTPAPAPTTTTGAYQPPAGTYGSPGYSGVYGSPNTFSPGGIAIPGGAVPAGPNPAFPYGNWTSAATNPSTVNNPVGNVSSTIGGVYGRALDYGNTFQNQFGTQYTSDIGIQNAYQGQSDQAYSDLYNTPGYTTAEQQAINQQGLVTGGMTSPDQFASNLLSPQEMAAIQANPQSALQYVGSTQAGLNANLYGTGGTQASPTGGVAGAFNTALANPNLTLSNQDVQNLSTLAAGTVGAQYGSMEDQLARSAAASGTANPLAVAAAQSQFGRDEAAQQAEAAAGAQSQARLAQIQTNQSLAGMQIGAATTLGQLGQGAQEFTGQLGTGAAEYADTAAAQRALAAAQNRQQIQQSNQSQAFGQGVTAGGALSASNQAIANARIAGQQAARNYWTSQGQFYGSQGQSAAQDVLAGAQTSLGAMGNAATTAANTSLGRQTVLGLPGGTSIPL